MDGAYYTRLVTAIHDAGFFATSVEDMGAWERVVICSRKRPNGCGYCGNSFWVTQLGQQWYLGAWGGAIYQAERESTVIEFAINLLTNEPDHVLPDFPADVRDTWALTSVSDDDFGDAIVNFKKPQ